MTRAATSIVRRIMTREPVTVMPGTSVAELMTLFDRHGFNAFPVVNPDGSLTGIVTKLDVLRVFRPRRGLRIPSRDAASVFVAEIMRPGVVNVEASDSLDVAAELMVATRLRSLPVVQRRGGAPELVGIVTYGDLLRELRHELMPEAVGPAKEEA